MLKSICLFFEICEYLTRDRLLRRYPAGREAGGKIINDFPGGVRGAAPPRKNLLLQQQQQQQQQQPDDSQLGGYTPYFY